MTPAWHEVATKQSQMSWTERYLLNTDKSNQCMQITSQPCHSQNHIWIHKILHRRVLDEYAKELGVKIAAQLPQSWTAPSRCGLSPSQDLSLSKFSPQTRTFSRKNPTDTVLLITFSYLCGHFLAWQNTWPQVLTRSPLHSTTFNRFRGAVNVEIFELWVHCCSQTCWSQWCRTHTNQKKYAASSVEKQ